MRRRIIAACPDLSALANRPLDDLARLVEIEKPSRGFRLEEPFERAEPYLHALRRRKPLRNTRDDHPGAIVGGYFLELGVVGKEHELLYHQPLPDGRVRNPALAEDNDVLGVVPGCTKPVVEGKREVLVEQYLHAAVTAGGRCSAT